MAHRIAALHRIDLSSAAQLAQQLRDHPGGKGEEPIVTVVDPALLNHAHANGMPQVQLITLPDCDIVHGVYTQTLAATRMMCAEADAVMAELVPTARGAAWCGHWLQFLHHTAIGYRNIGLQLAARLQGDTVHVLLPDLPHRFGYHSYVPGLLVSDTLRSAGIAVQLYSCSTPGWDAPLMADPLSPEAADPAAGAVDLLCHLPTCFYDSALFASEIVAANRQALVLPSPLFDVPLAGLPRSAMASPDEIARRLPAALQEQLGSTLQRLEALLFKRMTSLLPSARLAQTQVHALVEGYRQNALLYLALEQRFSGRPPRTLLISNHDVGFHGALHSFARKHGMRTLMLPHAKVYPDPLTSYGHDIQCLAHPLQGGDVLDLDGSAMPWAALDFGAAYQVPSAPPEPLATLGIVLNAVSLNNMPLVALQLYVRGLVQLRDWCTAQAVDCRIRCRPNGSVMSMLVDELKLCPDDLVRDQEGSIADFGAGCNLVLGYDVPTSGVLELLQHGVPVIQALCRRLGLQEWRSIDPAVVPQWQLPQVIERLTEFRRDGLELWRFRRQQVSQHAAASSSALPLRAWL